MFLEAMLMELLDIEKPLQYLQDSELPSSRAPVDLAGLSRNIGTGLSWKKHRVTFQALRAFPLSRLAA